LPQRNSFAEFGRQLFDGDTHRFPVLRTIECDACLHRWSRRFVQFFIENDIGFIRTIALEGGEGSVAYDAQKPGPAVFAAKTSEKSKRAQRSLLHNVFRVLIVAHKKAREVVTCVEMRQDLPLELG